jgi:hypothetical protein
MKKRSSKHYIDILPAALLPQRMAWQTVADGLPEGVWLLVLPKNNDETYQVFHNLARNLEKRGKGVAVLCEWIDGSGADWGNTGGEKMGNCSAKELQIGPTITQREC